MHVERILAGLAAVARVLCAQAMGAFFRSLLASRAVLEGSLGVLVGLAAVVLCCACSRCAMKRGFSVKSSAVGVFVTTLCYAIDEARMVSIADHS